MRVSLKITDGVITDVVSLGDDALAPVGYVVDESIPAGTGIGCRLVDGEWAAPDLPPAEPAPLVPLTARQLRLGLLKIGIKPADVAAAISVLPTDQRDEAEIEWDYASEYRRNHPLIATLGQTFGLSADQIDAAWRDAMAL
ncbi:hypothetical protein [Pleomorphomonas sp. JP5]|uniref:hypothetical protein n=1 Tax=Pleomorphomonas sp. JP5 TaxID=2942998 RepID=UPI00204477D6|nr:hypothetical protein [Pleomorphomonas sp. JP5]MCM5556272.1 hypothetical protein [Pleomorphomonas sp. JP5]